MYSKPISEPDRAPIALTDDRAIMKVDCAFFLRHGSKKFLRYEITGQYHVAPHSNESIPLSDPPLGHASIRECSTADVRQATAIETRNHGRLRKTISRS